MTNVKGTTSLRSPAYGGRQSFLPPKCPSISPAYADYSFNPFVTSKGIPKPREGNKHHQRTSSESFLIEEQPSWFDDLLNEPETPVRRGAHRRSSSDTFTHFDISPFTSNLEYSSPLAHKGRNVLSRPWTSEEHLKDTQPTSFYTDPSGFARQQQKGRETDKTVSDYTNNFTMINDKISHHGLESLNSLSESNSAVAARTGKKDGENHALKGFESDEVSQIKSLQPEMDQKRVKQQFAQRSRVRKLQYIAELERNVQFLEAEGAEGLAELQFIDQQNLILSLENKALKQRLDSLAQEHLLKLIQQEMLEREIARLRALCQQHQQLTPTHGRSSSRDLDAQFANLSLKHKEVNSGCSSLTGSLHI